MGCSAESHVGVLAFPFATHAGILLGLIRRLAAAAPNVNFSFFSTAVSNRSLFSGPNSPYSNVIPYNISDGVPEGYVLSGKPQEDINLFLAVASDEFKRGLEKAAVYSGRKITCLLADAFLWFSGDLAEQIRVPWVPLWTSGACSLSIHVYTDLIRQTVGLGAQTVVAVNSFEELDPDLMKDLKSKFKKILNVGPFNLTSPPPSSNSGEHGCISWLDNQNPKSVAYIAFGTVATPPPNELVSLAEALEESGTPFLWSLKDNFKNHLPKGFLERTSRSGKIVAWAPRVQVLSHDAVGVVITHGGWNSVVESIAAGVPVICRPFFGDHHINTWTVENVWKIGVRIEGGVFTKNRTMNALEQVMSQEKGKKLKEQISVEGVCFEGRWT